MIRKYDVGIYTNATYAAEDSYEWRMYGNDLYLQANGVLNVIDPDQSHVRACIPDALGYAPEQSAVIVRDASAGLSRSYAGILPLYSTEELIQIGREIVRDYEPKE